MSRSQQVALHGKDNRIGGIDPIPPGRWEYVSAETPLLNDWQEAGGGLQQFRWRRTNENQTEIQGFVHSGTDNPVINLPDPYRPAETQHAVGSNTDLSLIIWELTPAGDLNVYETTVGGAAGGALDGTYPNPGLAASVAGAGLAETTNVLSVNVDNSTIEINSDTLRVKSGGVTSTQIASTIDTNARVGVRKNSAGSTFLRRRINLIEGSNVTLTVADDSGSEEVDVTIAASGGSGAVATDTIWDAKGDLAAGTGADTASKLTVGSNDQVLLADSSQTTGLRWGGIDGGSA